MPRQKKTAIVTGGAQGIGKAISQRFLKEGVNVIIADIDEEAGEEFLEKAKDKQKEQVHFVPTNVANESSVANMVMETVDWFGRIDYLINNAAMANPVNDPIDEMSLHDWEKIVSVNLTGTFLCTKHTVPQLRLTDGAIVNLCSTRAFMSEPHTEGYSATKGGIYALTHALANSLGPDIRVNCISPGWIEVRDWQKESKAKVPKLRPEDHKQHPAGRVGKPEDIAALAWFLCSKEAGFITGVNFIADGGMTKKMIYLE
ncbi:MAG TPA: glucose 1-dehydrogenase [Balneolales bacterium]|nr:glucose 1-dehydrogenase [Balneolales bacterium]